MKQVYLVLKPWGHQSIAYAEGSMVAIATEDQIGAVYVPKEMLENAIADGYLSLVKVEGEAKPASIPSGTGFGREE